MFNWRVFIAKAGSWVGVIELDDLSVETLP